ncbi:MAG: TIGR02391 family protein [Acidimicrobiales bacterium]
MAADVARARELLDRAVELANDGNPTNFNEWRETARVALRVALGEGDPMLERFDAVKYSLGIWTDSTPQSAFDKARRAGVRRAVAILKAAQTELAVSKPDAPTVDVAALHPWVAGMAATLWSGGHHRQAVEEGARSIEVQLRAKLSVSSGTGAPLVTAAFSPKDARLGEPRLRFAEFPAGSESWTNAHEGAMAFGRGCMMRIRNLYSHGHEPSEQEALEALAALSLLARWIDESEVGPWQQRGTFSGTSRAIGTDLALTPTAG